MHTNCRFEPDKLFQVFLGNLFGQNIVNTYVNKILWLTVAVED